MKILIVEDDASIANALKEGLSAESYTVEIAEDGAIGAFMARSYDYGLIILDNSLPKKDGLTLCKEIRTGGKSVPIIFLSVNGDTETKVAALEAGADDYMTKPFSMSELRARIKAVIRRPADLKNEKILKFEDLSLDTDKQIASRDEARILLTRKEYTMLEYFMRNPGTVLSRATIMENVWTSDNDPFSNTVEAHIRNLRKKLNGKDKANMIANVQGRGYILDTPENIAIFEPSK